MSRWSSTRGSRPSPDPVCTPSVGSTDASCWRTEPLVVPAQRRGLAGDAAAGVLAGRQEGEIAADDRALDRRRIGDRRPAPPTRRSHGRRRRTPSPCCRTTRSTTARTTRAATTTRRRTARRQQRTSSRGYSVPTSSLADTPRTTRRQAVSRASGHGATSSNHPPASRTQPDRSRRARVIAASVSGRPTSATTSSSVHGSARQRCEHLRLVAPRQRTRVVAAVRHGGGRDRAPSSTSATSVTGVAPSRISWLVPGGGPVVHRPGHGHHLDRPLQRLPRRRQRTAALAALDHHDELAQRGEDAVALREPELLRLRARRPLRQQQTVAGHGLPQVGVDPRVRRVESVGHHADDAP